MATTKVTSDQIRKTLKDRGITIIQASERLGMTRQNLAKHLSKDYPSDAFVRLFNERLGMAETDATKVDTLKGKQKLHVLSVVTDAHDEERILYVDIKAQAGYALHYGEPSFVKQLPSFNLPFGRFNRGTYRAYEVEGDSMNDTLDEGDVLICSYLDPEAWEQLKENYIYVVVLDDQCLVKRVSKQGADHLLLSSDNHIYKPQVVKMEDVKELWYMHRAFKWNFKRPNYVEQQLEEINRKLDKLTIQKAKTD